jgi:hypothetical protein
MNPTMRPSPTAAATDERSGADDSGVCPQAGEVLTEIGLILAIHLAVALAVGLSLRALGIG